MMISSTPPILYGLALKDMMLSGFSAPQEIDRAADHHEYRYHLNAEFNPGPAVEKATVSDVAPEKKDLDRAKRLVHMRIMNKNLQWMHIAFAMRNARAAGAA